MQIIIDQKVTDLIPQAKYGIIHYQDITIDQSPQMLKGRIRLFQESLHLELEGKEMNDIPGVAEWKKIFKKTGTDPSRYRPSVEALYRRIKKGQFLEPFNSTVDLNNFFSLKYEIPFGIYDSSKIHETVSVHVGTEKDSYEGLNGRQITLKGMLHTRDIHGPFGSPFVDSKRTAISETSTSAIHIIYLKPSMDSGECKEMLESISNMFTQVHGGTSSIELVN